MNDHPTILQPKVLSIMIPTRARFDKLTECLRKFEGQLTPEERSSIEWIIKFDSDDTASLARIGELPHTTLDLKVIVGSKLGGYKDLFHFYNDCAALTRGTFLLMWNDDAHFRTEDWFFRFKARVTSAPTAFSYWFSGTPTLIAESGKPPRTEDWPCFIAHHRLFYQIIGFYGRQGGGR